MSTSPESVVALDYNGYNTFSITCMAEVPSGLQLSKTIRWEVSEGGAPSNPVSDNGDTITITDSGLDNPISSSVLMVTEDVAGQYVYTCTAIAVSQVGDPDIMESASTDVVVKGLWFVLFKDVVCVYRVSLPCSSYLFVSCLFSF